jgi:transcriptional regulator with XRE-family HTH domain
METIMEEALSVQELESTLGENIKSLRLQKNLDRQTLCTQAGISVSALRHLENGEGATLKTFIRILRALNKQDWLLGVAPKVTVNPLHMVKNRQTRLRASKKNKISGKKEEKQNV